MRHDISECSEPELHCWSHNLDEPDEPCYRICLECMHVYRSEGELQREWLENYPDDPHGEYGTPSIKPVKAIPVEDIYFCPLCSHDF